MSLVVHKTALPTSHTAPSCAPLQSNLFSELLGPDHDAWRVARRDRAYSFYREVGHDHPRLPFGSIVLTTEPGKPQTFDFYSGRRKHSLLQTFGDEVPRAAQILMDREHVISLFTRCAVDLGRKNWDHHLSFCGDQLKERCATLRYGTRLFDHVVGNTHSRFSRPISGREELSMPRTDAGLVVSQYDNGVPVLRCLIANPRTIEATFASSRLVPGLDAITGAMVGHIQELNRSVEDRGLFGGGEF
jgi:hypothetical protein